ncbi:hypothetical protein TNCT_290711 [Trichonephila clavata]|uniref:Uncharacterized protein n=1 Tax=Trichonephila clavata TaxID=2740835 RepID=A0A8X6HQ55_TRICU|nr:hypothetical protein TNCT_290711 [Trichonephila clavata]
MLRKTDGDRTMKQSQTFMWHKRFQEGMKSVSDDDRLGCPSTSQANDSVQKISQDSDREGRLKFLNDYRENPEWNSAWNAGGGKSSFDDLTKDFH